MLLFSAVAALQLYCYNALQTRQSRPHSHYKVNK